MNRPRRGGSNGTAAAWVVIAILVVGIVAVVVIGARIVVPLLAPAGAPVNEASAVGWLRVINSGEDRYSKACVQGGYAVSLDDLAKAPKAGGSPFVLVDIGTNGVRRDGYRFAVVRSRAAGVVDVGTVATTCNGSTATPATGYFASAEPASPGRTGLHYFATDASGKIFVSSRPIANPIQPSAAVVEVR
jgi:hypothetical protein